MTIDIDKYMVRDFKRILYEDFEKRVFKTYEGHSVNFYKLPKEDFKYIVCIMMECYESGARACVDEINRDADRQVAEAQNRAIKKVLKGKY